MFSAVVRTVSLYGWPGGRATCDHFLSQYGPRIVQRTADVDSEFRPGNKLPGHARADHDRRVAMQPPGGKERDPSRVVGQLTKITSRSHKTRPPWSPPLPGRTQRARTRLSNRAALYTTLSGRAEVAALMHFQGESDQINCAAHDRVDNALCLMTGHLCSWGLRLYSRTCSPAAGQYRVAIIAPTVENQWPRRP